MRRKRQELSKEQCEKIIRRATYGVLCVAGDNDYPYGVPVNYVYHEGKIYFHTALTGHKVDAMRKHDKVSMTIVDKDNVVTEEFTTYFRSVILFGHAHFIEDEAEKLKTLTWLGQRFSNGNEKRLKQEIEKGFNHLHMIEISIDHLSGKEAIEFVRMRDKKANQ
jgi:nitroimidazol reductase NimA-like FMN-containing flavoprotein (pyridoxamine 5'-phosphate oxidase superfamily)